VRIALTPEEIARLNSGEALTLNLKNLGVFSPSDENLRVVDIRVVELNAVPSAPVGNFGAVDIYFEHSGESTLTSRGRDFRFVHYNRQTEQRILWGGRYDLLGKKLDAISPSQAAESLIRALLGRSGINVEANVALFARPGAWADIRITREVQTGNAGVAVPITELAFEVRYDFVRRPRESSRRVVEVNTGGEISPYIQVSLPDLNNRQDGVGDFRRFYPFGAEVVLSAPNRVGEWRFAGFTDQGGKPISGVSLLSNDRALVLQGLSSLTGTGSSLLTTADADGYHRLALRVSGDTRIRAD